jgi:hypothetical protein
MSELPKFKFICDACGSMSIKVEHSDEASETTIVNWGRCNSNAGHWQLFAISPGTDEAIRSSSNLGR